MPDPLPYEGGHDDPSFPPVWPDDGLVHRIQLTVEVASGPGVEITAAELLLDVMQILNNQGIAPSSATLRITTSARLGR